MDSKLDTSPTGTQKPEISIILPSLRNEAISKCIHEFALTNSSTSYEIVVISPFKVEGEKTVHVIEKERLGGIYANNLGLERASAPYIAYWSDDVSPTQNCLSNILNFTRQQCVPFIGAFRMKNSQGHEIEQWKVYDRLYACFGCLSRETLSIIGGFLSPVFRSYWADPDMCLRTWENGGKVEVCKDAWIVVSQAEDEIKGGNWNHNFEADRKQFLDRWHEKLGKDTERSQVEKNWRLINKPVHTTVRQRILAFLRSIPLSRKIKRSVGRLLGA